MYLYEAVADEIARRGVGSIFSYLGDDIAKLVAACCDRGLDYYAARHENQAVAMADGFSRATGRTAVAAVTGGPGFTNALTAINTASRFGSGVVVVVGTGIGGPKDLSHPDVCAAMNIHCVQPERPADVVADVARAFSAADTGTATVLSLPTVFMDEVASVAEVGDVPAQRVVPAPDRTAITNVADLLEATWTVSRPVILAGRGAVTSGAGPALVALAERIGALLATTLRAPALFADDPFVIGTSGTYVTPVAAELLRGADCVLAFGASLNRFTTFDRTLFPQARIVHVDVAPEAHGLHVDVDPELAVVGDARLTAEALVAELDARGHTHDGYRTPQVRRQLAEFSPEDAFTDTSREGAIDPRTLALAVDALLPPDRVVVVDGGNYSAFWVTHLRVRQPQDFMQTSYVGGAGGIGLSLGAAIGAAIGRPDALVVNCVGDAAHLLALADLDTAARYDVPVVILISNDQALGAEVHYLSLVGLSPQVAQIAPPDLVAVARALGAEAMVVNALGDLDHLERRLAEPLRGPLVVDCRVDPSVRADWVDMLWGSRVLELGQH